MNKDEKYMAMCIELALKGAGNVSPNPMTGCVIVKNGKVTAQGWHRKYGGAHAEVNAINHALINKRSLKGATLYVNLEPCCHHGKTPPCTELIISSGIKEVVAGTKDPNPLVSGRGIRMLRKAGIKVRTGVLKAECRKLNRAFFRYITTGMPYVIIKTAQTIDGKTADVKGKSKWITSFESRKLVHSLRSKTDAVLIGRRTAEKDNPSLTVRHVKGRNPQRIIIDSRLSLDDSKKVFSDRYKNKTIVLASEEFIRKKNKFTGKGIKVIGCRTKKGVIDLRDALMKLGKLGISSILAEGGSFTHSQFLKQGLYDEMFIFTVPVIYGKGLNSFTYKADLRETSETDLYMIGGDTLVHIIK